jgi:NAD(P)-dependent dehydrogenase (short-subunit alcohol dehydrogenase family)
MKRSLVIITGTSKGIGKELVQVFLKNNFEVLAISRNKINLDTIYQEQLFELNLDVESPNFANQIFDWLITKNRKPLYLINNAGILINKPWNELKQADFLKSYAVNAIAPFLLVQKLIPLMELGNQKPHIVNITSMGGITGSVKFPGLTAYSSSKGAMSIITECLSLELKDFGISINGLAIGATQTEMLEQAFPGYKAPISASTMANFIFNFTLNAPYTINGQIFPVTLSTP